MGTSYEYYQGLSNKDTHQPNCKYNVEIIKVWIHTYEIMEILSLNSLPLGVLLQN